KGFNLDSPGCNPGFGAMCFSTLKGLNNVALRALNFRRLVASIFNPVRVENTDARTPGCTRGYPHSSPFGLVCTQPTNRMCECLASAVCLRLLFETVQVSASAAAFVLKIKKN